MAGAKRKYTEDKGYSPEEMDRSFAEYLKAVADSFGEPLDDRKPRKEGEPSLREVSETWDISIPKARQVLITAGVYSTGMSRRVKELTEQGVPKEEIAKRLQISRSSVASYLPYTRRAYSKEATSHAIDIRRYRAREKALEVLRESIRSGEEASVLFDQLEEVLRIFEKYVFSSEMGKFYYLIKSSELGGGEEKIVICLKGKEIECGMEEMVQGILHIEGNAEKFSSEMLAGCIEVMAERLISREKIK